MIHAYGGLLLRRKDEALKSYLIREEELLLRVLRKLETVPPEKAVKRISEVKGRLNLNKAARWF